MSKGLRLIEDDDREKKVELSLDDEELLIDESSRGRKKRPDSKTEDKPRALFESTDLSKQSKNVAKNTMRSTDLTSEDLVEREAFQGVEEIWGEQSTEQSVMRSPWVLGTLVLCFLMIAGGIVWSLTRENKGEQFVENNKQQTKEIKLTHEQEVAQQLKLDKKFKEIITGFFSGKTLEEKAAWCRQPESTLAAMKKYYQNEALETPKVKDFGLATVEFVDGQEVRLWNLELEGQKKRVPLLLAKDPLGNYALDWETMVCYQPHSWTDFIDAKDTDAKGFRVTVVNRMENGFYGYEFADDEKYSAYKVMIRGREDEFLWAYSEKGSALDKELRKQTNKGVLVPTMYLKLKFPKDAQTGECVHIEEIISSTWFKPDKE